MDFYNVKVEGFKAIISSYIREFQEFKEVNSETASYQLGFQTKLLWLSLHCCPSMKQIPGQV